MESHKLLSRRFLQEVCPAGADGFAALTPEIVIGYVERHALDGSADSGKAMCGVVRAFLCYLHLKGSARRLCLRLRHHDDREGGLERAGIHGYAHNGAHLFRHSLATDLLRSGASFAEISQLLRHRSVDSTRIYAKLDIEKLRELSLPWPGG
ncbi:tyrosine-type recombinase/integrase [Mesorhizobium sp.]|uniref:tyrosine-type recombinase/integrase n=1 Tax=Mesorhizobium sp. TaxID=1871066 RepID=UPI0025F4E3EF|nr:tyrosine-type recombinase/integrase [Mesorhizobium sp.]